MTDPPTIHDFMAPIPVTIEPQQTIAQAEKIMDNFDCRHLPVVSRAGHLVGILSQRDIALAASLATRGKDHTVEEAMSQSPFTCGPEAHLHAVATEMAEKKIGTAVVVRRDRPTQVVGLFTTVDALQALATFTNH